MWTLMLRAAKVMRLGAFCVPISINCDVALSDSWFDYLNPRSSFLPHSEAAPLDASLRHLLIKFLFLGKLFLLVFCCVQGDSIPPIPDLIRNYHYRKGQTVLQGIVATILLCCLTFQHNRLWCTFNTAVQWWCWKHNVSPHLCSGWLTCPWGHLLRLSIIFHKCKALLSLYIQLDQILFHPQSPDLFHLL